MQMIACIAFVLSTVLFAFINAEPAKCKKDVFYGRPWDIRHVMDRIPDDGFVWQFWSNVRLVQRDYTDVCTCRRSTLTCDCVDEFEATIRPTADGRYESVFSIKVVKFLSHGSMLVWWKPRTADGPCRVTKMTIHPWRMYVSPGYPVTINHTMDEVPADGFVWQFVKEYRLHYQDVCTCTKEPLTCHSCRVGFRADIHRTKDNRYESLLTIHTVTRNYTEGYVWWKSPLETEEGPITLNSNRYGPPWTLVSVQLGSSVDISADLDDFPTDVLRWVIKGGRNMYVYEMSCTRSLQTCDYETEKFQPFIRSTQDGRNQSVVTINNINLGDDHVGYMLYPDGRYPTYLSPGYRAFVLQVYDYESNPTCDDPILVNNGTTNDSPDVFVNVICNIVDVFPQPNCEFRLKRDGESPVEVPRNESTLKESTYTTIKDGYLYYSAACTLAWRVTDLDPDNYAFQLVMSPRGVRGVQKNVTTSGIDINVEQSTLGSYCTSKESIRKGDNKGTNVGPIVGAIVGVVLLTGIILAIYLRLRKRGAIQHFRMPPVPAEERDL